ncbi:hypothetical protein [Amphibiibacter pelophylacis]|uniref:Uncharacterized protein n=1 Tax=Amphibiibacter pelophylacis TaxID=1799477 RepID=A0ACC6NY44_9BURK
MKRLGPAAPYAYPRFFLVMALVAPVQEWSVIGAWSLHPKRPLFPFALSVGMQRQRGPLELLILQADDSSDPRRHLAERLIMDTSIPMGVGSDRPAGSMDQACCPIFVDDIVRAHSAVDQLRRNFPDLHPPLSAVMRRMVNAIDLLPPALRRRPDMLHCHTLAPYLPHMALAGVAADGLFPDQAAMNAAWRTFRQPDSPQALRDELGQTVLDHLSHRIRILAAVANAQEGGIPEIEGDAE